jgi:hypothetical protein
MPRQGQDILKYSYEKADGVKGPNQNHLHPDMKSYRKFSQKKNKGRRRYILRQHNGVKLILKEQSCVYSGLAVDLIIRFHDITRSSLLTYLLNQS